MEEEQWILENEEEDDDLMLILSLLYTASNNKKIRKHKHWIHPILRKRKQYGAFYHLVQELKLDDVNFQKYFRTNKVQFQVLLELVGPSLHKRGISREPINSKQRLAICLRYLATGESFQSLAFSFRVSRQSVSRIIREVCHVLWRVLKDRYMRMPQTEEEWLTIAANFEERWNFPHCVGALDGKHVVMRAPSKTGSLYFNYKGTFSIVLMALVDANLKFIYIDVGAYGRNSDGGIFRHCNLGKALNEDSLHLPRVKPLRDGERIGPMPYVLVADEAFPLQTNLMRPFPGRGCSYEKRVFNYRLSRARRVVENAFGVLAARWRVFHTKLAVQPLVARDIVKATCCLHNMLQRESSTAEVNTLLQGSEEQRPEGMTDFRGTGNKPGKSAETVRNHFKDYFVDIAPLSWQHDHVNRGMFV